MLPNLGIRKSNLDMAIGTMWYFCAHSQRLITGIGTRYNRDAILSGNDTERLQCRLSFSGTFVLGDSGERNKNRIPDHEVLLGLLYAAVTRKQRGVLRYLERAESRESDVWAQQDYRVAQVVLILADEGKGNPYSKAFRQLFGKDAHEIRFWWRDREKLFAVSQIANSSIPLCYPDIGRTLPDEPIPDYDYSVSADHPRALPPTPASKTPRQGAGDQVLRRVR